MRSSSVSGYKSDLMKAMIGGDLVIFTTATGLSPFTASSAARLSSSHWAGTFGGQKIS
jgi:hypothetical protein